MCFNGRESFVASTEKAVRPWRVCCTGHLFEFLSIMLRLLDRKIRGNHYSLPWCPLNWAVVKVLFCGVWSAWFNQYNLLISMTIGTKREKMSLKNKNKRSKRQKREIQETLKKRAKKGNSEATMKEFQKVQSKLSSSDRINKFLAKSSNFKNRTQNLEISG